jgi:hypothetical protein
MRPLSTGPLTLPDPVTALLDAGIQRRETPEDGYSVGALR